MYPSSCVPRYHKFSISFVVNLSIFAIFADYLSFSNQSLPTPNIRSASSNSSAVSYYSAIIRRVTENPGTTIFYTVVLLLVSVFFKAAFLAGQYSRNDHSRLRVRRHNSSSRYRDRCPRANRRGQKRRPSLRASALLSVVNIFAILIAVDKKPANRPWSLILNAKPPPPRFRTDSESRIESLDATLIHRANPEQQKLTKPNVNDRTPLQSLIVFLQKPDRFTTLKFPILKYRLLIESISIKRTITNSIPDQAIFAHL